MSRFESATLLINICKAWAVGSSESFTALNRAIEINNIHPVIDKVFPMDEVQQAYRRLEQGKHVGKIVISLE